MHFNFQLTQDHLRAELFGRQTLEDTLQFVEVLAGQQGASVRAFREESRALDWLTAQSQEQR